MLPVVTPKPQFITWVNSFQSTDCQRRWHQSGFNCLLLPREAFHLFYCLRVRFSAQWESEVWQRRPEMSLIVRLSCCWADSRLFKATRLQTGAHCNIPLVIPQKTSISRTDLKSWNRGVRNLYLCKKLNIHCHAFVKSDIGGLWHLSQKCIESPISFVSAGPPFYVIP